MKKCREMIALIKANDEHLTRSETATRATDSHMEVASKLAIRIWSEKASSDQNIETVQPPRKRVQREKWMK